MTLKELKAFILGVLVTAAAALLLWRGSRAVVFFDPLGDPDVLQCTFVMHPNLTVPPDQQEFVAQRLGFCKPKTGYHYYPCRCGLVKP